MYYNLFTVNRIRQDKGEKGNMTEFLVRHFIKDYKDVEKISVRTAYGVLSSIVGIFCNVFLFVVKFVVGIVLHSVSVTADAFNNLSDAGSSIISFVGVKMAEKPADRDHPFGHGRTEFSNDIRIHPCTVCGSETVAWTF